MHILHTSEKTNQASEFDTTFRYTVYTLENALSAGTKTRRQGLPDFVFDLIGCGSCRSLYFILFSQVPTAPIRLTIRLDQCASGLTFSGNKTISELRF